MELPMIKKIVCICLLTAGGMAQAKAEQGCPYPSSIRYVQGYFQATDGQVHWRSSDVGYRDFIDVFIGALFTPGKGQERVDGYLERCIYRTGGGQVVALRYGGSRAVDSMSLTGTLHWRLASDAFGQPAYICQDSQPDNCSFTARHSKP